MKIFFSVIHSELYAAQNQRQIYFELITVYFLHYTIYLYSNYFSKQGAVYLAKCRPVLVNSSKISDRFFLSTNGAAIQESNMSKYFTDMFEMCSGRQKVTPHTLRHLFATNVADSNPDQLKVAAKFMAHSVNTLETVYAEASEKGQILLPSIFQIGLFYFKRIFKKCLQNFFTFSLSFSKFFILKMFDNFNIFF